MKKKIKRDVTGGVGILLLLVGLINSSQLSVWGGEYTGANLVVLIEILGGAYLIYRAFLKKTPTNSDHTS